MTLSESIVDRNRQDGENTATQGAITTGHHYLKE